MAPIYRVKNDLFQEAYDRYSQCKAVVPQANIHAYIDHWYYYAYSNEQSFGPDSFDGYRELELYAHSSSYLACSSLVQTASSTEKKKGSLEKYNAAWTERTWKQLKDSKDRYTLAEPDIDISTNHPHTYFGQAMDPANWRMQGAGSGPQMSKEEGDPVFFQRGALACQGSTETEHDCSISVFGSAALACNKYVPPVDARFVGECLKSKTLDTDNDGVPDYRDNCLLTANQAQTDADGDRYGAACDPDDDDRDDPVDSDENDLISVCSSAAEVIDLGHPQGGYCLLVLTTASDYYGSAQLYEVSCAGAGTPRPCVQDLNGTVSCAPEPLNTGGGSAQPQICTYSNVSDQYDPDLRQNSSRFYNPLAVQLYSKEGETLDDPYTEEAEPQVVNDKVAKRRLEEIFTQGLEVFTWSDTGIPPSFTAQTAQQMWQSSYASEPKKSEEEQPAWTRAGYYRKLNASELDPKLKVEGTAPLGADAAKQTPRVRPVGACTDGICVESGTANAFSVNGENGGIVRGARGQLRVSASFYAFANTDRMPLRRVIIDWGSGGVGESSNNQMQWPTTRQGGSKTGDNYYKNHRGRDPVTGEVICGNSKFDEFGNSLEACETSYINFTNDYVCTKGIVETLAASKTCQVENGRLVNSPCTGGDVTEGAGRCVFQPRVHVMDNWGWCTGTCVGGADRSNGCYDGLQLAPNNTQTLDKYNECDVKLCPGGANCGAKFPNGAQTNESATLINPWVNFQGYVIVDPPGAR